LERKASGEVHEDEEPAAIVGKFGLVCWLDVGVGAVVFLEVEVRISRGVCECECELNVGDEVEVEVCFGMVMELRSV
jgi:hypothetical protein